jgi:hypothetical protein
MVEFCPECGARIPKDVNYCTACGIALDSVIKRDNDKKPEKKSPVWILVLIGFFLLFVVWISIPFFMVLFAGLDSLGTDNSGIDSYQPHTLTTVPATTVTVTPESKKDQNIRIIKKIVEDYHKTHTYSKEDMFVCADMAIDVWNMVITQDINAIIRVGRVDKDITELRQINHAWVMAEVAPGEWIALETTGGYLVCPAQPVCQNNNSRYYTGWDYAGPKEFKEYLDKLKHPCPDGYILGNDRKCHEACGGNTYCVEGSVCVNGDCRGCDPGYVLGQDYRCYQECPAGSGRYCTRGVCGVDGACH